MEILGQFSVEIGPSRNPHAGGYADTPPSDRGASQHEKHGGAGDKKEAKDDGSVR